MSLILDEHRQYLSDEPRLRAFDRAIRAVVRPGDVVVDLGCGTGVLGLLACRAGAARVYAIDDGGMIGLAREIARANGFGDRVVHIAGTSTRVTLDEPADLVISDQVGRLGFEAGVIQFYADAQRRFLKPGGGVLPAQIATCVAPVEAPEMSALVDFWREPHGGLRFDPVCPSAGNTGYPADFRADQLLGQAARAVEYDLRGSERVEHVASGQATLTVDRPGTLSGLAGWFEAVLAPGITATNAPGHADRISRRQSFLPIAQPVEVLPGDLVAVSLVVRPTDVMLVWRVQVTRAGVVVARSDHDTLGGMLITAPDLARTRLDARPKASEWALARSTVIALADGRRSLRDIEHETFERHRHLFQDESAAASFVSRVVSQDNLADPGAR